MSMLEVFHHSRVIMKKQRNPVSEQILNLTLEILYLLTGEEYIVMKKPCNTDCNRCHDSEGSNRTPSPSIVLPLHSLISEKINDEKILELTHAIIRLLTGEVPVRCEDVTVYLSMEEWEYLEGHRDLYKDLMMDDHQFIDKMIEHQAFSSLGEAVNRKKNEDDVTSVWEGDYNATRRQWEKRLSERNLIQAPLSCNGAGIPGTKVSALEKQKQTSSTSFPVKEESRSRLDVHLTETEVSEPDETPQTETMTAHTEKDPVTGNISNDSKPKHCERVDHTTVHIKEEMDSCEEECLTVSNTIPPVEYLTSPIKDETATREEDFKDIHVPTPSGHVNVEYKTVLIKQESGVSEGHFMDGPTLTLISENGLDQRAGCILDPKGMFNGSSSPKHLTRNSNVNKYQVVSEGKELGCSSSCVFQVNLKAEEQPSVLCDTKPCSTSNTGWVENEMMAPQAQEFVCSYCGKCFRWKGNLNVHLRIHTGEKPFVCTVCGKDFTNSSNLFRHQRVHTGNGFTCSQCGKSYTDKSSLVKHQRIHTGEKPFSCPECGKRFVDKTSLASHQKVHAGEKPFSCPECGEGFISNSQLLQHQRTHRDDCFPCSDCGKYFTSKSNLLKHQRIHTGNKPFSCSECGKSFIEKSMLIYHQRIHTGEKPFPCSECGKSFARSLSRTKHQRTHSRKPRIILPIRSAIEK